MIGFAPSSIGFVRTHPSGLMAGRSSRPTILNPGARSSKFSMARSPRKPSRSTWSLRNTLLSSEIRRPCWEMLDKRLSTMRQREVMMAPSQNFFLTRTTIILSILLHSVQWLSDPVSLGDTLCSLIWLHPSIFPLFTNHKLFSHTTSPNRSGLILWSGGLVRSTSTQEPPWF